METVSRILLTFLLNALWQVPIVCAIAALACRVMSKGPASHRHAVWVAALVAAILLPIASVRTADQSTTPQYAATLDAPDTAAKSVPQPTQPPAAPSPAPSRTISFAETTASILLGVYLLALLYRLARLGWASVRTVQIRNAAHATPIPELLRQVWARCEQAFGVNGAELLFSAQVPGPVTAGRTIILPESLLAEASEDVLATAIGHEMAHIARHDFSCNVLYELFYLPIGFHPAAWLIRRGIGRTREVACDELVTRRLMDAGVYARSIVSIAAGMTALPHPGYTLGVFDGDILEERIRRLVERPAANLKRARLLLVTGLSALAICAVIASSLALTARAQGGAYALMKQAEAAYNRGDLQGAIALFESAAQVEPANLKAKLFLANALLQQYLAGPDAASPVLNRAQQQLLDVLARDPNHKQALQGMMSLKLNTKQFAEAHDWAVKAIQADATDKFAYYTAAFIDWSMTYPDYGAARQAAGMKSWDPGIIPDAGLRQSVRVQHGARLDDGFRMLQTALQLDPDYSDAMAYMNLLYRIEAGIADSPAQYADFIAKADDWVDRAIQAKRRRAQYPPPPPPQPFSVDGPPSVMMVAPPPPPPPPPPPGQAINGDSPKRIAIGPAVQASRLVSQTPPAYPAQARQAGITGTVQLGIVIAKDGTVKDIRILKSVPELDVAALEAVKTWAYQPTLLNGEPVEVATTVNVTFGNGGQ